MELTPRAIKEMAIERLRSRVQGMEGRLTEIDARLTEYYREVCEHSSAEPGDSNDLHNALEILGALKLLRLMNCYPVDVQRVKQVIRLREGEWHREGKMWIYDKGGLSLPGTRGATHYRWEPYQIFILTSIYGPYCWIDTQTEAGTRPLAPTERVGKNGNIEDYRRLCINYTYYAPRKTDKTGLSGYCGVLDFMLGDYDGEAYCCGNSQSQSKIIYERMQGMVRSLDSQGRHIRFTATQTNWKPGQLRKAKMEALSAGGKTKDGLFASYCAKDEFGSSPYTNGKSDMGSLVNVIESSMGPRREPLSVTTTTAGTIETGPFIEELAALKASLIRELEAPFDSPRGEGKLIDPSDRVMALLLTPDEWEMEEEYLFNHPHTWKKVNPMLGIIVQHSFYEQAISESRSNPLKKIETLTKLFNVYQSSRVEDWIKASEIYPLQTNRRIEDCKAEDGWVVLCGMDFSKGDDLHAMTYLAIRPDPAGGAEFFADMDSWVTESAMQESSIRLLLEKWVEEGWLHVSPGKVLESALPVNRLIDLIDNHGVSFIRWGYDSYQNSDPVNALKAYLWDTKGVNPDQYVVAVSQTLASYNPAVIQIEKRIWADPPQIELSANPMWPWQFGNCVTIEDVRMRNRKMIKKVPSSSACKVDNIQCLATCWLLFEQIEGKFQTIEH